MITKTLPALLALVAALSFSGCVVYLNWDLDPAGTGGAGSAGGGSVCTPGAIVACYDGPAGTEGQGICKAGAKTCAPDRVRFGPCEGAIAPLTENCATPVDEDCDGLAPACKGTFSWAKRFGDSSDQEARSIAVDAIGNVLLTGYVKGSIDFGGGPLNGGVGDAWVAKLDPGGGHLWSNRFGGSSVQSGQSIATDSAGNVFITGYFNGDGDFGGGVFVSTGPADVFIAKLGADGTHLWSKSFGGEGIESSQGLAVDSAGNVVITGHFSGSVDFGGGVLTSAGNQDVFVVKLSADGTHLWSKRFGDPSNQGGQGVAVDGAGNVLLTSYFNGTIDFGGGPLASAGNKDVFVAKLDPGGAHLWSKRFGDADVQYARSVAVDSAGNVIITGNFNGTIDFGGSSFVSGGGGDIFLAKLDANGAHVWSKAFGDANVQDTTSVAVDASGNMLITGSFLGTVYFGGGPLPSLGLSDMFLAKLDADGAHLWSQRFGNGNDEAGVGVALDAGGNTLIAGYSSSLIDF
ncbi:MAG: SBBP repeat-containing protein, partial [Byssovorax sp.]